MLVFIIFNEHSSVEAYKQTESGTEGTSVCLILGTCQFRAQHPELYAAKHALRILDSYDTTTLKQTPLYVMLDY